MSWDNQQPPWGQRKGGQSPEEQLAALVQKIKNFFSGGGGQGGGDRDSGGGQGPGVNPGLIAGVIGVVLVGLLLASSFYTIRPGEQGVVLRLGAYYATTHPGLNFKIPLVDVVHKVDMETVRKEQFGFRTRRVADRTQYQKQGYTQESLMLTSDRNVIDMEWVVQYRVDNPYHFLFRIRDISPAVRDVSEMTLRRLVGNMDFDAVLDGRAVLADAMARELQETLNRYESGIQVITVQLQDVNPPEPVKPAFNEVNEADQDMQRLINEAEEIYNREVPRARGDARRIVEEAHGYKVERVNEAQGQTARFTALLEEYDRAPEVTRQRLYLETMREVLPKVEEVVVIDSEQKSLLPLLNLGGGGLKAGN
ncbi:FtsH protease activity modulator HflK [Desulfurivibrio dismutans]|uniref:FtsH protease activity modulator HflK n=1 Tax=Desulfurivibrio dismutans TaxID=1398908 RepID=UPI0023DCD990|nr:FtsH protease activity modulator HflK [Desulfurivibrio alkaliphilus]MDF1615145.1 FtsH protease activity modulator HflK [Desulfurivibrio alkaliphilus]